MSFRLVSINYQTR